MKTKKDLEKLAGSVGATLEEDTGYRDMRTFQICAPDGQRWKCNDTLHILVQWAKGSTKQVIAYNEDEYGDAECRVKCGLEAIPAEEMDLYSND